MVCCKKSVCSFSCHQRSNRHLQTSCSQQ
uniref:Uncharacterized protein n=1 Tax=Anguilla anguilla TaxID=7936 RepID=A0A0E9V9S4_ANGAN